MNDRSIVGIIGLVGFLIIALTTTIPVILHIYGIDDVFAIKASVGLLTMLCGYGILWGFFKKESPFKQKKEGKIQLRLIPFFIGLIIIAIAWFSDIPLFLADWTGLSQTFTYDGETLNGGLGTRLWTSFFTCIGVLLIKFSFYRHKVLTTQQQPTAEAYSRALDNGG